MSRAYHHLSAMRWSQSEFERSQRHLDLRVAAWAPLWLDRVMGEAGAKTIGSCRLPSLRSCLRKAKSSPSQGTQADGSLLLSDASWRLVSAVESMSPSIHV